jgi:hypothetical protein
MEWKKNKNQLVAYSLGNFVSGQRKRYTDGGAMIRLELEKIKLNDSISFTGIDTAGYILEWVYRTADAEKNYYVLPVPTFENDSIEFIKDVESRLAFRTFIADSRKLFKKYNLAVDEYNSSPRYNIEFPIAVTDTLQIRRYIEARSHIRMLNDHGNPRVLIGPFTYPDANHILKQIRREKLLQGGRIDR